MTKVGLYAISKSTTLESNKSLPDLQQLYQRVRRVLMEPHERPIYAFHW